MDFKDFNSFVGSADEIIPGIWVGNQRASQSAEFMKKNNIKLIVNATKTIPSKFLGKIHYVRVPVNDPGIFGTTQRENEDVEKMKKSLPVVLPIIKKFYDKNIPILIHCHAGAQRSAIIAAVFLVKYGFAKDPKEAISIMVERRPIAFFGGKSVNFRNVFE